MTTLADDAGAPAVRETEPAPPSDPPRLRGRSAQLRGRSTQLRGRLAAYVALTKPRIIELLLISTVPTMVLAARGMPPLDTLLFTLVGGSLAAGSANALNCWYDRDIDVVMRRTSRRPLVRHEVSPRSALVFGLGLGAVAAVLLAVTTNVLSAALAVATIAFYVLVYTMVLKRRTSQNVVWGGAAGCMPALIGWSAVTGRVEWPAVVLFGVIFLWTPPHTWALAMRYRDDYANAGVPMLPVVATPLAVARRSLWYSLAMVAVSLLLVWPLGVSGPLYAAVALVLGAVFLRENALWVSRQRGNGDGGGTGYAPMRLFHWSITYLALLFLAVAVDQLV